MNGAHFCIMARDAHESFAGFTSPADDVNSFHSAVAVVVVDLISGALRIRGVGIDEIALRAAGQSYAGIGGIPDRENHGVYIKLGRALGGFAGHTAVALQEHILSNAKPINPSRRVRMNRG